MARTKYSDFVYYTGTNNPVYGVPVTVFIASTTTPAVLYDALDVVIPQPLYTATDGYFEFYADAGLYDIDVNGYKKSEVYLNVTSSIDSPTISGDLSITGTTAKTSTLDIGGTNTSTDTNYTGLHVNAALNGAGTGNAAGINSESTYTPAGASVGTINHLRNLLNWNGSVGVTAMNNISCQTTMSATSSGLVATHRTIFAGLPTLTSGSTVSFTSIYGMLMVNTTTAATNFIRGINLQLNAQGAETRHNLYVDGTAPNHIAGSLGLNTVPTYASTYRLAVDGRTVLGEDGTGDDGVTPLQITGNVTVAGTTSQTSTVDIGGTNTSITTNYTGLHVNTALNGAGTGNIAGINSESTYTPAGASVGTVNHLRNLINWNGNVGVTALNNINCTTTMSATSSGLIGTSRTLNVGLPTLTAGSTCTFTSIYGILIGNVTTVATNFIRAINTTLNTQGAETRYNLYIDGTAPNYFAGAVGIGTAPAYNHAYKLAVNGRTVLGAAGTSDDGATAVQVTGTIKQSVYTFATLPTGAAAAAGARAFVSDALDTVFGSTIVAGGGTNFIPVYHDGTNWRKG